MNGYAWLYMFSHGETVHCFKNEVNCTHEPFAFRKIKHADMIGAYLHVIAF